MNGGDTPRLVVALLQAGSTVATTSFADAPPATTSSYSPAAPPDTMPATPSSTHPEP